MGREGIVLNIIDYLDNNLTEEITIDNIAGKFHFNRFYLMKMFKKVTGITILEYVNQKKIKSSLDAVLNTDDKILKIALTHGFNSQEYYSEVFTKVLGISPREFRKKAPIDYKTISMGDDNLTRLEQIQSDIKLLNSLRDELLILQTKGESRTKIPLQNNKTIVMGEVKPKVFQLTNTSQNRPS